MRRRRKYPFPLLSIESLEGGRVGNSRLLVIIIGSFSTHPNYALTDSVLAKVQHAH